LREWHKRIAKLLPGEKLSFVCEHKMDGLAIALTVIGYNLLGDGLRAWLDPRPAGEWRDG